MGWPQSVALQGMLNSVGAQATVRGRLAKDLNPFYTYHTLIDEARFMLGDVDDGQCPVRYPDALLLNGLNRGLQELARIRPDAFYTGLGMVGYDGNDLNVPIITDADPAPVDEINWDVKFGIEFKFYPPLVNWVTGITFIVEDAHVNDRVVETQLQLFESLVLSV